MPWSCHEELYRPSTDPLFVKGTQRKTCAEKPKDEDTETIWDIPFQYDGPELLLESFLACKYKKAVLSQRRPRDAPYI